MRCRHARRASSLARRCCPILIPLLLATLAQAPNARAWGWSVHRMVASTALGLLPGDAGAVLSSLSGIVVEWSVMPDVLKSSDWYEQYRHWYHVDVPHDERQYWEGVLPWAVEYYFQDMVEALRAENLAGAAQLAGRLSHYIADASMPLHATKYYDGMHSPFERAADGHLSELDVALPGHSPRVLENVLEAIVGLLELSYSYSEEVRAELYNVSTWTPKLRDITEVQLRAAVALTADVWYTAYVRATSPPRLSAPSPLSPADGAASRSSPVLSWSPARGSAPPFAYEVLLDDDPNFLSPRAFWAGGATELALPELEDGEYYWRVLARDALGGENLSDGRRFLVDSVAPPAPKLLSPTDGSELSRIPTFEWSVVIDPTGVVYELLVDDDPNFETPRLRAGDLVGGSYTPEGALEGGTWYWRVRAVDGAGNESWSETFRFTIGGGEKEPSIAWPAIAISVAFAALVALAASRWLRRVGPKVRR